MIGKHIKEPMVGAVLPEYTAAQFEQLQKDLITFGVLSEGQPYAISLVGSAAYRFKFVDLPAVREVHDLDFELLIPVDDAVDLKRCYITLFGSLLSLGAAAVATISSHMDESHEHYKFILFNKLRNRVKLTISFCSLADFADFPSLMSRRLLGRHLSHTAVAIHLNPLESDRYDCYHAGQEIRFLADRPSPAAMDYAHYLVEKTKVIDPAQSVFLQHLIDEQLRLAEERRLVEAAEARKAIKAAKKAAEEAVKAAEQAVKKAARLERKAAKLAAEQAAKLAAEQAAKLEAEKALPLPAPAPKKKKKNRAGAGSGAGASASATAAGLDLVESHPADLSGDVDLTPEKKQAFFDHVLLGNLDLRAWLLLNQERQFFTLCNEQGFTGLELAIIYGKIEKIVYLFEAMERLKIHKEISPKTSAVILACAQWELKPTIDGWFQAIIDKAPVADQKWLTILNLMKKFDPHRCYPESEKHYQAKNSLECFAWIRLICLLGHGRSLSAFIKKQTVMGSLVDLKKSHSVGSNLLDCAEAFPDFYVCFRALYDFARVILLGKNSIKIAELSNKSLLFDYVKLNAKNASEWVVKPLLYQILISPFDCKASELRLAMEGQPTEVISGAFLIAVHRGEFDFVQLLLAAGANPSIVDGVGHSALDILFGGAYVPLASDTQDLLSDEDKAAFLAILERGDLPAIRDCLADKKTSNMVLTEDFQQRIRLMLSRVIIRRRISDSPLLRDIDKALNIILIYGCLLGVKKPVASSTPMLSAAIAGAGAGAAAEAVAPAPTPDGI